MFKRLFTLSLGLGLLWASTASAQFSQRVITNDADALLPGAVSYTHAVDLNTDDGGAVINGVTFGEGAAVGSNYTLAGDATGNFQGFDSPADPGAGGAGLEDLLEDFFFELDPAPPIESLTLTGLSSGVVYRTTFINAAFGGPGGRVNQITADDPSASTIAFDQNFAPLNALDYTYTLAPGDTDITFTFNGSAAQASFHQYGFANAVVPEPASLGLLGFSALGLLARRRKA